MSKNKTFVERIEMRKKYLDKVWDAIVKHMENEGYFEMGSCNKDYSRYLVSRGTEDQVSYHGKHLEKSNANWPRDLQHQNGRLKFRG